MTKTLLIIALAALILYYCYQKETKPDLNESWIWGSEKSPNQDYQELTQTKQANQSLMAFLRSDLNSNSLEELKNKLNSKTLNELIEENSDWETEIDTLTRTKNSLEQDLTAQAEAFQARLREKDRELKKAKQDLTAETKRLEKLQQNLTSEKQQHKGSIERINLLTQQVQELTTQKNQSVKKLDQITNLVSHWEINSLTKKQLTELKNLVRNE